MFYKCVGSPYTPSLIKNGNCINGEDIETWFNIPQEEEVKKMVISISDKNLLIQLRIAFHQKILNLEYG